MLKINSVKTVCFVNPPSFIKLCKYNHLYHRRALYSLTNKNADITVYCVSALDFVQNFENHIELLCHMQNYVLFIHNKNCLKKFGLKIDANVLQMVLSAPVVLTNRHCAGLLDAIHMSSCAGACQSVNTPNCALIFDACIKMTHFSGK